ncbi:phosphoethanolamine transferase EptA [Paramixta manurensis]|uniref:Phosphoethanolamine transferase EptA n=1 Tax=Paramixta manurensis TaxID=2740817 RepID=A0A6M8UP32_9GAMM|nr:phosphoethanolamine transferase EptA [Erwiniaceae bacterium PD-1]
MHFSPKLRCNEITFNFLCAAFFTLAFNGLFIADAWKLTPRINLHDTLFIASIPLVLFAAFTLIFNLLALPWIRKPLLIILVLVSAAANYFMYNFGTVIDTNMVQNVFETDLQEASALLTGSYLMWMALAGVLPVLLIAFCKIEQNRPWWFSLALRALYSLGALLLILLVAALFYKDYASMIRNNKGLVKMITPVNIVSGSGHYIHDRWFQGDQTLVRIGQDAKKGPIIRAEHKKTLVIFVLGETARAENFSLGGYQRETNPQLKKQQVIYYQHATSCGTETAISVPCMFSNMPRVHYNANLAHHQEGALDILAHAGVNVLWRENDGGCKGACDRVPHTDMTQWRLPEFCAKGYCRDGALLQRLNNYIEGLHDDSVIVLHQMGSHGPAYYLRYPPEMRHFTPTCDSNQIQDCDHQALINTYDNSLLYTDAMVSDTINLLKGWSGKFNVALIYLSDHGESLGEHGMYLHGTPYVFAPEQQTHIPLLMWMSPDYASTFGINQNCLRQHAQEDAVSQDNLFHTLLGMFNIQTSEYQPQLDMNKACQSTSSELH